MFGLCTPKDRLAEGLSDEEYGVKDSSELPSLKDTLTI